jgi:DNA polymerase III alpha subunit
MSKIKSIVAIGCKQTYNLEMASTHHNYVTVPVNGQPIHRNSHSTSYIMQAYLTAWLKIHYPPEWWASVMSRCHSDKRVKYMNVARSEGVKFSPINVEDISTTFTVDPTTKTITPGLTSIKNIGKKAAAAIIPQGTYANIDEFIAANGKNKTIMQRLILLGAFKRLHPNVRACWMWYQYKYCTGKDITLLKKEINDKLLSRWTPELIKEHIERSSASFKNQYPKRKIPKSIINWKPKPEITREKVMAFYPDDYSLSELLDFEKLYLGYYWHNPVDLYHTTPGTDIKAAKASDSQAICGVVEKLWTGKTKKDSKYGRLTISDGLNTTTILIWEDDLEEYADLLKEKVGIKVYINYDKDRDSFTLQRRGGVIAKLLTHDEYKQERSTAILEDEYVS